MLKIITLAVTVAFAAWMAPGTCLADPAHVELADGAILPDGQVLHVAPGENAFAIPNGFKTEVVVLFPNSRIERLHLWFRQDLAQVENGQERRADGTLKSTEENSFGHKTIRYYEDGRNMYSITSNYGADTTVEYMRPDGQSMLWQTFDKQGKHIGDRVTGAFNKVKYDWTIAANGHLCVTYYFEDIGGIDFEQEWKSPLGSAEPKVVVSWTDDNQKSEEYEVTLTSDGARALSIASSNGDGTKTVDTLTDDSRFVAHRQKLNTASGAVLTDTVFNSLKPRPSVPSDYYLAPPAPASPESVGLKVPN